MTGGAEGSTPAPNLRERLRRSSANVYSDGQNRRPSGLCRMKQLSILLFVLSSLLASIFSHAAEPSQTGHYHGHLHPNDRYHYDLHDLKLGDRVRIELKNVSGNLGPFLRVVYKDFTVEDDDSGKGADARVNFVAPEDGTYDIESSPYVDATFGEYELTIEVNPPIIDADSGAKSEVATLDIERSHSSLRFRKSTLSLRTPEISSSMILPISMPVTRSTSMWNRLSIA